MMTGVRRRATWLLAALLTVALAAVALAAFTGKSNEAAPTNANQALLYAQCMRDNGVPDFPDPDANGQLRGAGHEDNGDPKFSAAMETCRDLAPGGEHKKTGDPAFVEQMREFSQCMRDNGVPDFPDPDANGQLRGSGHEDNGDPKYSAAMETCREKLPGGGDH